MYAAYASWVWYLGGRGIKGCLLFQVWLLLLTGLRCVLIMVLLMTTRGGGTPCIRVVERRPLHVVFVLIVSTRHCAVLLRGSKNRCPLLPTTEQQSSACQNVVQRCLRRWNWFGLGSPAAHLAGAALRLLYSCK